MGNVQSIKKINFEDMQSIMKNPEHYIIINTLPLCEQQCLITNTIHAEQEEKIVNNYLNTARSKQIIVYGKHCNDESVEKKCQQLLHLGFHNIYVYNGGLFEWHLLQDIYGDELFPTTQKELDILKFKQTKSLVPLLTNF